MQISSNQSNFILKNENGMIGHIIISRRKLRKGAAMKSNFLFVTNNISFENNLIISLKGCKSPKIPTLLGPFRI